LQNIFAVIEVGYGGGKDWLDTQPKGRVNRVIPEINYRFYLFIYLFKYNVKSCMYTSAFYEMIKGAVRVSEKHTPPVIAPPTNTQCKSGCLLIIARTVLLLELTLQQQHILAL